MTPVERAMIRYVAGNTLVDASAGLCSKDMLARHLWLRSIKRRSKGTRGKVPTVDDVAEATARVMGS